jgi:plasmid maintenance system antidote protein VapI
VLIYAYKNVCYVLIIVTFKHEKDFWLVLKCIHDLQKKRHSKQTKTKTKDKKQKNTK